VLQRLPCNVVFWQSYLSALYINIIGVVGPKVIVSLLAALYQVKLFDVMAKSASEDKRFWISSIFVYSLVFDFEHYIYLHNYFLATTCAIGKGRTAVLITIPQGIAPHSCWFDDRIV